MGSCSCELEIQDHNHTRFFPNHYQFSRRKFHLNQHWYFKRDNIFLLLLWEKQLFLWTGICVPLLLTAFPSKRKFKPTPHLSSSLWEFWICHVCVWPLSWNSMTMPDFLPEQRPPFSRALKDLFSALIHKHYSASVYFHKLWVVKNL